MGIKENLEDILEQIENSCTRAGRHRNSVTLSAVSKFHPVDSIIQAIEAGQMLFSENRVQEACDKFPDILSKNPDVSVHMIGTLQRNKVKRILPLVSCIQSVDRPEILAEIGKESLKIKKEMHILFEIQTGEESKAGFPDQDSLFRALDELSEYNHVVCAGLMTMAPFTGEEKRVRSSFRTLVSTAKECEKRFPTLDFSCLSMGMSGDFQIAIEEGSTLVRVGTAIFGTRT